jgi:hypothetical protein
MIAGTAMLGIGTLSFVGAGVWIALSIGPQGSFSAGVAGHF